MRRLFLTVLIRGVGVGQETPQTMQRLEVRLQSADVPFDADLFAKPAGVMIEEAGP